MCFRVSIQSGLNYVQTNEQGGVANRHHYTAGTMYCGKAADSVILPKCVGFRVNEDGEQGLFLMFGLSPLGKVTF